MSKNTAMKSLDLDVATPEEVPAVLRNAVDKFRESVGELQAAWGDKHAGLIWGRLSIILERAAKSCDAAIAKGV